MSGRIQVKWEYLFLYYMYGELKGINDGKPAARLKKLSMAECANQLGEEGWELTSYIRDIQVQYLTFKRPKD